MKKRICQIGGLLCSVVLLAVSVVPMNVFAADKESKDSSAGNETIVLTEDELSSETIEALEELMLGDEFQEGSIHILGELDGDTIYAKVADVTTETTTASTYSNFTITGKTFDIYIKNSLGVEVKIFSVSIQCYWLVGERIVSMMGMVQNPKSGVSYKWNDNLKHHTDNLSTLGLDLSYGTKSATLYFFATLGVDSTTLTITLYS